MACGRLLELVQPDVEAHDTATPNTRQFYESALTDHKNTFLFITKTHDKVHKTHGKSLQKRIDLKTEDADRWQQSLQQQFIMVVRVQVKT